MCVSEKCVCVCVCVREFRNTKKNQEIKLDIVRVGERANDICGAISA